jgi:hypothetical protein
VKNFCEKFIKVNISRLFVYSEDEKYLTLIDTAAKKVKIKNKKMGLG